MEKIGPWNDNRERELTADAIDSHLFTVRLELPYPAVSGNHAVRHAQGRHYRTDQAQAYRVVAGRVVAAYKRSQSVIGGPVLPLGGPLAVEWVLAPPDRRARDQTNVLKEAEDAMTHGGLWVDDSNKVIRRTVVEWTDPVPGGAILLTVMPFRY